MAILVIILATPVPASTHVISFSQDCTCPIECCTCTPVKDTVNSGKYSNKTYPEFDMNLFVPQSIMIGGVLFTLSKSNSTASNNFPAMKPKAPATASFYSDPTDASYYPDPTSDASFYSNPTTARYYSDPTTVSYYTTPTQRYYTNNPTSNYYTTPPIQNYAAV